MTNEIACIDRDDLTRSESTLPRLSTGLVVRCDVYTHGGWQARVWPIVEVTDRIARVNIGAGGRDPTRVQNIRVESANDAGDVELIELAAIEIRIDGALVMRQSRDRREGAYARGGQRRIGTDRNRIGGGARKYLEG